MAQQFERHSDLLNAASRRLQAAGRLGLTHEEVGGWLAETGAHPPFDGSDLGDVVNFAIVGRGDAETPTRTRDLRKITRTDSHAIRALQESESRLLDEVIIRPVCDYRRATFGVETPPFASRAEATTWIEAQPDDPHDPMWFLRTLAFPGEHAVRRRHVSIPTGAGWVPSPSSEASVEAFILEDSLTASDLGKLYLAANEVAALLGCADYQAVGHILWGGVPFVAPVTVVQQHLSIGGVQHRKIQLTVNYDWVPASVVRDAYRRAAEPIIPVWEATRHKTPTPQVLALLAFVRGTPNNRWDERRRQWNAEHPDSTYASARSMSNTFSRAKNRGGG